MSEPRLTPDNTQANNQENLPEHPEDLESIKCRFSWKSIAGFNVPYIIRTINGEHFKYVSKRMVETQIFSTHLKHLHEDVYTCISVRLDLITIDEARLLDHINQNHSFLIFGNEKFLAGKDLIVRLEDDDELYKFIKICYSTLMGEDNDRQNEFGFIRNNLGTVLPYRKIENQKYVPLFYLSGKTDNLKNQTLIIRNWDLAYLKFCCLVQGIKKHLFAGDSCEVVNIDLIKNRLTPETYFEEFWPCTNYFEHLLVIQDESSTNANQSASESVVSYSVPVTTNENKKLSYSDLQSVRSRSLINTQQQNSLKNYTVSSNLPSSPDPQMIFPDISKLKCSTQTSNQHMTRHNPMTNSSMMSNQVEQFFRQSAGSNSHDSTSQFQQYQIQQQEQQIKSLLDQPTSSGQSMSGRGRGRGRGRGYGRGLISTQQQYAQNNSRQIISGNNDLSTRPSSLYPQKLQTFPDISKLNCSTPTSSRQMTTFTPLTNSSMMSNQVEQFFRQSASSSSQASKPQFQQYHIQQHQQKQQQQQQQQNIITLQGQQTFSGQSERSRRRRRHSLGRSEIDRVNSKSSRFIVNDLIDLSSPPSSPDP